MTDKKEKIISVALDLFANKGYNVTSTSKIAKAAGVSEGLIFRHFKNKKGLLDAIFQQAEQKVQQVMGPILFETDPRKVIEMVIKISFDFGPAEYNFWKLQFKLKWEEEYNHPEKMKPLLDKVSWAFQSLGYAEPEKEAQMLNHLLENILMDILRNGREKQIHMKDFLLHKYS